MMPGGREDTVFPFMSGVPVIQCQSGIPFNQKDVFGQ